MAMSIILTSWNVGLIIGPAIGGKKMLHVLMDTKTKWSAKTKNVLECKTAQCWQELE